jgi:hypothetical protein
MWLLVSKWSMFSKHRSKWKEVYGKTWNLLKYLYFRRCHQWGRVASLCLSVCLFLSLTALSPMPWGRWASEIMPMMAIFGFEISEKPQDLPTSLPTQPLLSATLNLPENLRVGGRREWRGRK